MLYNLKWTDYELEGNSNGYSWNIKESTKGRYNSQFAKLKELMGSTKLLEILDLGTDAVEIVDFIEQQEWSEGTKKNYVTMLISLTRMNFNKKLPSEYFMEQLVCYRDSLGEEYETKLNNHEKTTKQEENWITFKQILEFKNRLHYRNKDLWNRAPANEGGQCVYTDKELRLMTDEVIIELICTQPPRRNDYANMSIMRHEQFKGIQKDDPDWFFEQDTNWLVRKARGNWYFVFCNYKTSSKYGMQFVDVKKNPSVKKPRLKKWVEIMEQYKKADYFYVPLLLDSKGNEFNTNSYSKRVQTIFKREFNKKVGTSLIRHIYLSDKYGEQIKEMEQDAEDMAHSYKTQNDYVKYNAL